jgi:hypothetical protein
MRQYTRNAQLYLLTTQISSSTIQPQPNESTKRASIPKDQESVKSKIIPIPNGAALLTTSTDPAVQWEADQRRSQVILSDPRAGQDYNA